VEDALRLSVHQDIKTTRHSGEAGELKTLKDDFSMQLSPGKSVSG